MLAKTCLVYLSHIACQPKVDSVLFPLLEYAVLFWCYHCTNSTCDPALEREIGNFLSSTLHRQFWILQLLFYQSSTFPLQQLMKLQKSFAAWIAETAKHDFDPRLIDWMQDIPDILIRSQLQLGGPEISHTAQSHMVPRISYFDKMMVIRDLSREFTMSGRLEDGERWLTEALDNQRSIRGPEHISTAWLMNSLGIIYDQQQRVELSACIQEQALAIQESNLGSEHPEAIWTVNELGRIHRHLQQYRKAEHMHLRALRVLRTTSPSEILRLRGLSIP
jgi:hypothetical protein